MFSGWLPDPKIGNGERMIDVGLGIAALAPLATVLPGRKACGLY